MASKLAMWLARVFGSAEQAAEEPYHYELVPFTGDEGGRGFYVERSDGRKLHWRTLPRGEGLESLAVVGVSHRLGELQHPAFAPGATVSLVPEPGNPHDPNAVGVWDEARERQVGYVAREDAARIARKLARRQITRCMSMWETRDGETRVALRILLIGPQARIRNLVG